MSPPNYNILINNFKVIHSFPNKINLKIAEALEIKYRNPFINVKYNDHYQLLKLF
jgi:hypothetical protein